MAQPDFYKILGVRPDASADDIRSAYRNLVKKYHPDIFTNASAKKKANEKLQQINEAYAILGDQERRRDYDAVRAVKNTVAPKPATPTRNRTVKVRKKAAVSPDKLAFLKPLFLRWAAWGLGAVLVVIAADAVWSALQEEKVAWMLWAKTVVEPPQRLTGRESAGLASFGRYGSKSECANKLKELVAKDEREGSKAIVDELSGTVAITIHLKNEETLTQEFLEAKLKQNAARSADLGLVHEQELLKRQAREEAKQYVKQNGIARHETTYACRAIPLPKRESFLQRTLKSVDIL